MYTDLSTPRAGDVARTHKARAGASRSPEYGRPAYVYVVYERVRNGGPWDYKQHKRAYADFGNFHYGAVGYAACIPAKILLIAAGAAQWKAGTSRPEWGNFTGTRRLVMIRLTNFG